MSGKHFMAAMYLRLSKDDSDVGDVRDRTGIVKYESDSIGNQRKLLTDYIHEQQNIELYDIYIEM